MAWLRVLLAFLITVVGVVNGEDCARARQSDSTAPAYRAGIDIVSLNVTVTDSEQRFINDLSQSDFTVLANGSGSMKDALPIA